MCTSQGTASITYRAPKIVASVKNLSVACPPKVTMAANERNALCTYHLAFRLSQALLLLLLLAFSCGGHYLRYSAGVNACYECNVRPVYSTEITSKMRQQVQALTTVVGVVAEEGAGR